MVPRTFGTLLTLVTLAALAAGTALVTRAHDAAAQAAAGSVAYAIGAGDSKYAMFDYDGALREYEKAIARDSSSADLWWRASRSLADRGTRAMYAGKNDAARTAFADAVRAARRATSLAPDAPQGHLRLAIALGKVALLEGGKEKVRISKEVRAEAERTILLDRGSAAAYHVLGRWNRGIAELSFFEKAAAKVAYGGLPEGATMNNAVTYFEKAIEIEPNYANHHLELGRTFLKLGLKDKARAEFEKAIACPPGSPFDAEYKNEASRLLTQVK
jgi:tetratricopeptide (TPR) repeat protein